MDEHQVFDDIKELRSAIALLRELLKTINDEKEIWFTKKSALREQITSLISGLKESKSARDKSTAQVKLSKEKREGLNDKRKELQKEVKVLEKERTAMMQKLNLDKPPMVLKKSIEHLERKMETEALPFNKEKELMAKIKEIKKKLEECKGVDEVSKKLSLARKELSRIGMQSQEFHLEVTAKAKLSQEKHVALVENAKSIDHLRKEEKESTKKALFYKEVYNILSDSLKEYLDHLQKMTGEVVEIKEKKKKEKIARNQEMLEEKGKSVEEKIKLKKKLTKDDLLLFQATNN
ncbi:hypothetical protein J4460_08490 [Candidatus Woesearchaeota archaeon]|nr:MAG: phosphoserine phosphatase [archaeon GW2011_AR4]MBS3130676.1 hypothetical protein [Candidatus Woesearchaeota archaeon]HIH37704.1 hypothetical protein [Candidatus Woesearchaeota archaeon]HIH48621.1 hypothetical protein [Candidatus Woesearchaeota archaeon]HIJ03708.1 hypothetical protein [Candidatus Woesearchaeota archaeon]